MTKAQRLKEVIDQIEQFRFCGPSDDPDEQTAVLYGFRRLLTTFKRACRSLSNVELRQETQDIADPETLYEAYDAHSKISAMLDDINANLEFAEPGELSTAVTDLRAFISYSTADKLVAGQIKAVFDEYEIASFLAHEDIVVSQEWRERILDELQKCNVFVPLLTLPCAGVEPFTGVV